MQEQMGNVSRKRGILRKNKSKCQRLKKKSLTEMKNAFDGFSRLDSKRKNFWA